MMQCDILSDIKEKFKLVTKDIKVNNLIQNNILLMNLNGIYSGQLWKTYLKNIFFAVGN